MNPPLDRRACLAPSLDSFNGAQELSVYGIVRPRTLAFYQEMFRERSAQLGIPGEAVFETRVHEPGLSLPPVFETRTETPFLHITGWPRQATDRFPPQNVMRQAKRLLGERDFSFWQVAVVDPDSRRRVSDAWDVGYIDLHPSDFPRIASECNCSVLLSGGVEHLEERFTIFVDALLKGELPQLPGWHVMPPLS